MVGTVVVVDVVDKARRRPSVSFDRVPGSIKHLKRGSCAPRLELALRIVAEADNSRFCTDLSTHFSKFSEQTVLARTARRSIVFSPYRFVVDWLRPAAVYGTGGRVLFNDDLGDTRHISDSDLA